MAIEKLKYIVTADTKGFSGPMKAIGALAVTAFIAAVKVTAEFEKELSKLRAISGATATEMVALEKKARDLGKTTAFTAKEVAGLQTELAKLGFTTNDILNASGGVLDLAAGLGSTLADAATLTGSTLRAFGLSTEETGRVVDVLAKSASSSALDFSKLTESLKIAAPIAKATGTSIERTVAILGTLANAGIHGSTAGTAFRKTMIELNAAGLTLNDAYALVNTSTDKLGAATELVGKRAASAFLIMAQGAKNSDELALALRNAEGAAEEMRKIMEDNLIGDFDKLKSAVTEMGIEMGQTVDGPMRAMTQALTSFINGTDDTLGIVDSLTRAFFFLQESLLLMARGSLKARIAFNDLFKFGGNPALTVKLKEINKELDDINTKIINISDYGGIGGGDKKKPSSTVTTPEGVVVPGGGDSTASTPNAGIGAYGFNLEHFLNEARSGEESFAKFSDAIRNKSAETTEALTIGWTTLGASIAGALAATAGGEQSFGQIAGSLLKAVGGALISIGIAAVAAGKALAIFGIGVASIAQGYYAIGIGAALVAGGAALSKSSSGGGASSSSSASNSQQSSRISSPSSIQGSEGASRIVGEIRGQDIRLLLQRTEDSYEGLS